MESRTGNAVLNRRNGFEQRRRQNVKVQRSQTVPAGHRCVAASYLDDGTIFCLPVREFSYQNELAQLILIVCVIIHILCL